MKCSRVENDLNCILGGNKHIATGINICVGSASSHRGERRGGQAAILHLQLQRCLSSPSSSSYFLFTHLFSVMNAGTFILMHILHTSTSDLLHLLVRTSLNISRDSQWTECVCERKRERGSVCFTC